MRLVLREQGRAPAENSHSVCTVAESKPIKANGGSTPPTELGEEIPTKLLTVLQFFTGRA